MADSHFLGLAGQLHFLSDIAELGYNIAVPSPDEGDDVVTSCPLTQVIQRVQVKTSRELRRKDSFSYQFNLSDKLLKQAGTPARIFVFSMRRGLLFHPLVFPYCDLDGLNQNFHFGTRGKKSDWVFSVTFSDKDIVTAGAGTKKIYLNEYLRSYSAWPRRISNTKSPTSAATAYVDPW